MKHTLHVEHNMHIANALYKVDSISFTCFLRDLMHEPDDNKKLQMIPEQVKLGYMMIVESLARAITLQQQEFSVYAEYDEILKAIDENLSIKVLKINLEIQNVYFN